MFNSEYDVPVVTVSAGFYWPKGSKPDHGFSFEISAISHKFVRFAPPHHDQRVKCVKYSFKYCSN